MKTKGLKELTIEELQKKLEKLRSELHGLNLRKKSQLENSSKIKTLRRSVAKVLTILNQKKVGK